MKKEQGEKRERIKSMRGPSRRNRQGKLLSLPPSLPPSLLPKPKGENGVAVASIRQRRQTDRDTQTDRHRHPVLLLPVLTKPKGEKGEKGEKPYP